MADACDETEEPVVIPDPETHHPIQHSGGALSIAALFVSLVSIGIAYHHGHVMEELVHQNERLVTANSLPYLQLGFSTKLESGEDRPALIATNPGMGPAIVRTVEVTLDGKRIRRARDLMIKCCGFGRGQFVLSTLTGQMMRPGDQLRFVDVARTAMGSPSAEQFSKAVQSRIFVRACYCSVFDDCWWADSSPNPPVPPKSVPSCPATASYMD